MELVHCRYRSRKLYQLKMSRITKMKSVAAETKMDYELPSPGHTICTIIRVLGNSTYLVGAPDGEQFIASMPAKFGRHVHVRRRGFVVTEAILKGKKVKAEIVRILQRNQIKHFHQVGVWPEAFKSTVYIDNSFAAQKRYRLTNESDRGVVHGEKYFFMDGDDCRPVMKNKEQDFVYGVTTSFDELRLDVDSRIEPNYNKKAVTFVITADSDDNGHKEQGFREESDNEGRNDDERSCIDDGSSDEKENSDRQESSDEEESSDDEESCDYGEINDEEVNEEDSTKKYSYSTNISTATVLEAGSGRAGAAFSFGSFRPRT
ncbi:hypothetical protein HAZT_HAZT002069 [Hyalella azteca]|uniref:Probable RNA-binding protein EIF1AD n=1 Tax=Hyalella azteca TaxID=294128 RepID=A0A6A0GZF5_HYAAZ|nr:hypothetical protein HAZT_HAZT002069 [Hyalella azteca]